MNTLIELYGERAIENILGPETFRPQRVVYLCPQEIAENPRARTVLRDFFHSRGLDAELEFLACSVFRADRVLEQLRRVAQEHPDCALDITGGTEAALFAGGMLCREIDLPAFTYSRRRGRFYSINRADFADDLPCTLSYTVEEFFRMTGGSLRQGRVDNNILGKYLNDYDPFFRLFLRFRAEWGDAVADFRRVSQVPHGENIPLRVRNARVTMPADLLRGLEKLGFLREVSLNNGTVSFAFRDHQTRTWLRDVGSVLELYMYKACLDSGLFSDVISSAVVDWDGTSGPGSVSNEIDVVAARGVVPLFISCKACEIHTEALNELAVLRDRFGGKGAKAVIATSEPCVAAARHRAAQLGIAVIDREELCSGRAAERLEVIMKAKEFIPVP